MPDARLLKVEFLLQYNFGFARIGGGGGGIGYPENCYSHPGVGPLVLIYKLFFEFDSYLGLRAIHTGLSMLVFSQSSASFQQLLG